MKYEQPLKSKDTQISACHPAANVFPMEQSLRRKRFSVFNPEQAKTTAQRKVAAGPDGSVGATTTGGVECLLANTRNRAPKTDQLKSFPAAQIEGKDWILDVIADLFEFSNENGLSLTMEALQATYNKAAKELGARPRLDLA